MMTEEEIRKSAQEVFDIMAARAADPGSTVTEADVEKVKAAYAFAAEAHKDQKRKGGDPYIVHPIAVARIVAAELEQDANVVCAAFLHDVVEDTPYTIEEIRERFGEDVAFLVDVVTKRKKNLESTSKQVDNFKQILDSVHYDIRALMIKLSDRLHNMRTLDSMRPDKQMKIAGETDFFYAPLANRLGLYRIKSELENLSFRFRCPRDYEILDGKLEEDRLSTLEGVRAFTEEIDHLLREKGIHARTEVRYRKPYSIWRDMKSHNEDFSHVEFKHYVRVIYTPSDGWGEKDTSLWIYSVLSSRFRERPGSVVNYIDNPKENGYQSFHVKLLGRPGCWEELHISSERMLRNSRLGCIDKTNEETMTQWLDKLRSVLEDVADQDVDGFMKGVSLSFYNEDIYVLTPKGRVVLLPQGASAIDFAYELHTDIGDHAKYARINGILCPVKTQLRRGDCVEIGTGDDCSPQPQWLEYVKSYKALSHLRGIFKNRKAAQFERCPICHPLPGDEVIGFQGADGRITLHTRHCAEAIALASEHGDSIVSVSFESEPDLLYPVSITVTAIDRYHLLQDIITCITERQHLSMTALSSVNNDQIATCVIDFNVHSSQQLSETIASIAAIDGVDEVRMTGAV